MRVPAGKKVVCMTGNVWTGESALDPRNLLVDKGYRHPMWFTRGLPLQERGIKNVTRGEYKLARYEGRLLAASNFGSDEFGILKEDMEEALAEAPRGALVSGPQDIVAQVADEIRDAIVFTLKSEKMKLSKHLKKAKARGQVVRIDIDSDNPVSWRKAHEQILEKLGIED